MIAVLLGDSASARAILTGHETAVLCAAVSSSLGLVVSGSQGIQSKNQTAM